MFRGCLVGRLYLRDTCENQLSPSCPNSSHSSHVQGTCITSRKAYSRDTRENSFSLQLALSLHIHSLPHTTLTNKSHNKYKVQKIEHNYNQIWHEIKANKNIVVNYNFTPINSSSPSFIRLAFIFFESLNIHRNPPEMEIQHFADLLRFFELPPPN